MIEILSTGMLNTVQDLGRHGWLASGVSIGGAMDRPALETANRLLGNTPDAACIEVQMFPFQLRAHVETAVSVTGADCEVTIGETLIPPWWVAHLRAGEVLALKAPRSGARAYVAFAGGIDVPAVLGSRSTNTRGGFGGFEGRGVTKGDRLPLGPPGPQSCPPEGLGAAPPERMAAVRDAITVRALPAAEFEDFTKEARHDFVTAVWTVTAEASRMGYRLSGPSLARGRQEELLSHGIMPGTVQAPDGGQPMIQLADANTCGGYPKIATVIDADLWQLAQAAPGATLRFALIDDEEADDALRSRAKWMEELSATRAMLAEV